MSPWMVNYQDFLRNMTQFNQHHIARQEKGFSLLIALIFVGFFGSVLTSFVYSRSGESLRNEAEITGWQIGKLARAARIYVRDQLVADPGLRLKLAGNPQDVSVSDLVAAALLPNNFARTSDGSSFTALGQEIRIIMANYPLDGNPDDFNTVPTAYVYLVSNDRSNGSLVQDIVKEARRQNVAVSAPLFGSDGKIRGFKKSTDGDEEFRTCKDGLAAVIWDTGCLSDAEFTDLTGDTILTAGSLVIPAWRSVNFDTRILMRFPQPEGTGASTMLTTLEMGDPLPDCKTNANSRIKIPSDTGESVTDLCGSESDNVGGTNMARVDHRRDILNTRDLTAHSYINHRQDNSVFIGSGSEENPRADRVGLIEQPLTVTGHLTAIGDMKVFGGDIDLKTQVTVDRNISVPTRADGTVEVTAHIGRLTANSMTSDKLDVAMDVSTEARISANDLKARGTTTSIDDTMVTNTMQMNKDAVITTTGGADMLGETIVNGSMIVDGETLAGYDYNYVTGELTAKNILHVEGTFNAEKSAYIGKTTVPGRVDITNGGSAQCRGDCPLRTEKRIEDGPIGTNIGVAGNGTSP